MIHMHKISHKPHHNLMRQEPFCPGRNKRHREIKQLAQGHTVSRWQDLKSNRSVRYHVLCF